MADISISGTAIIITCLETKEELIETINIYPTRLFLKVTVNELDVYLNRNHIIKIEL